MPPFLKIWLEAQPRPPPYRKGGVHTMTDTYALRW